MYKKDPPTILPIAKNQPWGPVYFFGPPSATPWPQRGWMANKITWLPYNRIVMLHAFGPGLIIGGGDLDQYNKAVLKKGRLIKTKEPSLIKGQFLSYKYNENLNKQLKNFFKHYKFVKLEHNYINKSIFKYSQLAQNLKQVPKLTNTSGNMFFTTPTKLMPISYNQVKPFLVISKVNNKDKICSFKNKVVRTNLKKVEKNSLIFKNFVFLNFFKIKPGPLNNLGEFKNKLRQKNRIYAFLQLILVKYLQLTNLSKKSTETEINTPLTLMKSCCLIKLSKKDNTSKFPLKTSYFLFNKINNKSFLSYWLLPLVGIAIPLFTTKGITDRGFVFNQINDTYFKNIKKFNICAKENMLKGIALTKFYNKTYLFNNLLTFIKAKEFYSLAVSNKNAPISFFGRQNLLPTIFPIAKNQTFLKRHTSATPFLNFSTIFKSINPWPLWGWQYINIGQNLNPAAFNKPDHPTCFIRLRQGSDLMNWDRVLTSIKAGLKNKFVLSSGKGVFIKKEMPHNNKLPFYTYPINLQFFNNNINFLTTKNTLKLFFKKILKFEKFSFKPGYLLKIKCANPPGISTLFYKDLYNSPLESYKEGLNLIKFMPKFINAGNIQLKKLKSKLAMSQFTLTTCIRNKNLIVLNYFLDFLNGTYKTKAIVKNFRGSPANFFGYLDTAPLFYKAVLPCINRQILISPLKQNNLKKTPCLFFKANKKKSVKKLGINIIIKTKITTEFHLKNIISKSKPSKKNRSQIKKFNNFFTDLNRQFQKYLFFSAYAKKYNLKQSKLPYRTSAPRLYNSPLSFKGLPFKKRGLILSYQGLSKIKRLFYTYGITGPVDEMPNFRTWEQGVVHQEPNKKKGPLFVKKDALSNKQGVAFNLDSLQFQKKRKAKKQRLETRRQKKRTRFFPRPNWLRYRMFFNFINERISVKKLKKLKKSFNSLILKAPVFVKNFYRNGDTDLSLNNLGIKTNKFFAMPLKKSTLFFIRHKSKTGLNLKLNKLVTTFLFSPKKEFKNFKNIKNSSLYIAKIKENFVNFKNQKTNNPPPNSDKDKDNDTLFRDFWIWAYNNTSFLKTANILFNVNNNNAQDILLANLQKQPDKKMGNFLQINPVNLEKQKPGPLNNQGSVKNSLRQLTENNIINKQVLINWAVNKTFLNLSFTDYNKRYNLWNTQKLRNQSKNNKTKKLEKQFNKYWDSINQGVTMPFRPWYNFWCVATFKNCAFLKKVILLDNFLLNNNLTKFYKKIVTKLNKKTLKLNYLITEKKPSVFVLNTFKTKNFKKFNSVWYNEQSSLKREIMGHLFLTSSKHQKEIFKKFQKSPKNFFINSEEFFPFKTDDLYYQVKILLNKKAPKIQAGGQINLPLDNIYNILRHGKYKTSDGQSNWNSKTNLFILSSFLLHLCALISLVSISQVRCFIKFHVILLYKLSNIYMSLIDKIYNNINPGGLADFLKVYFNLPGPLNNLGSVKNSPNLNYLALINLSNKKGTNNINYRQKLNAVFLKKELKIQNFSTSYNFAPNKALNTKKNNKALNFYFKKTVTPSSLNYKKLLTYFSFNLLNHASMSGAQLNILALKLAGALENFDTTPAAKIKVNSKKNLSYNWHYYKYNNINVMYNSISPVTQNLKKDLYYSKKGPLLKKVLLLKGITKKNTLALASLKISYANNTNLNTLSNLPTKSSLGYFKSNNLYKLAKTKYYVKKTTYTSIKKIKNKVLQIFLNLIDLFQTSIRNISNFFEKPAEYTTSWIAFGFLVEWSSDLITIIPENIDIYLWNVFSKITRIIPTTFILNWNFNKVVPWFGIIFNLKYPGALIHQGTQYYKGPIKNSNNIINGMALNLTISYLSYRRLSYLYDTLIETISLPDTDLISRQAKGTLFWDIWADFLVTAADYHNVNMAALSTIKSEQNTLIDNISNDNSLFKQFTDLHYSPKNFFNPFTAQKKIKGASNKALIKSNKGFINKGRSQFLTEPRLFKGPGSVYNNYYMAVSKNINTVKKRQKLNQANIKKGMVSKFLFSDRWSVNQFLTYQSWHSHNGSNNSNGDLFIDYHTPKAFSHIPAIKYNNIVQQPLGNLVCQIYSGIFNKQISKNILLVNTKTSNSQKFTDYNVLLIQALAGETELKIVTDNAQRYALVNRGFAIGIKLLRDVFDAIALNTPCIFLLEDIHAIGERRPMLISDFGGAVSDDNNEFKEDFFGSQRDEVHEKNQVVYQLTRHKIAHYKKPFKGDHSLAIPTNLYITDLFLKQPTPSTSNLSLIFEHNLTIKNKIKLSANKLFDNVRQNLSMGVNNKNKQVLNTSVAKNNKNTQVNNLALKKAPINNGTSPFSVLLLKEEKRLKPNKIVEELAWTGLPGELLATKPRTSYSVRAKVAQLAELSLSNISAKLDMITDLLVIIDSVRSNKGFVVFATTDVPHVLDPALRRPGRLDETICLPAPYRGADAKHPNFNNNTQGSLLTSISSGDGLQFNTNYETIKSVNLFKTRFKLLLTNGIYSNKLNHNLKIVSFKKELMPKISKDSFFSKANNFSLSVGSEFKKGSKDLFSLITISFKDYNTILAQTQNKHLNYALISHSYKMFKKLKNPGGLAASGVKVRPGPLIKLGSDLSFKTKAVIKPNNRQTNFFINSKRMVAYYETGKNLLNYYVNKNMADIKLNKTHNDNLTKKSINYLSLFGSSISARYSIGGSKNKLILQVMLIFGGKISLKLFLQKKPFKVKNRLNNNIQLDSLIYPNENLGGNSIRTATTMMLSFIQKRYLYQRNLIVPKLLSFVDGNILDEPPCPPFSSLLIPAKRFENYNRVFKDSIFGDKMGQRKDQISLAEKIRYQIRLNSIKNLNQIRLNKKAAFNQVAQTNNNPLQLSMIPPENTLGTGGFINLTNINWYYQNRILKRHGQYLTNQWWNGQLSEHNAETVFLSDIDWRYSFIKNTKKSLKLKKVSNLLVSLSSKGINTLKLRENNLDGLRIKTDVFLDFPDTDQYYNPKRRRWLLNKGYWSFWFNFDQVYSEKIIKTWILESITQTYKYLHNNLELLDFLTSKFISLGYQNPTNPSDLKVFFKDFFGSQRDAEGFVINNFEDLTTIKKLILTNSFKRF